MIRTTVTTTVLERRWLAESTFILSLERKGVEFLPGQYVSVGTERDINMREYSVYSPPGETGQDPLEILVRVVPEGLVSRRLASCRVGDSVTVEGPFGFFTIDEDWQDYRYVFLGTGTGISPFHCFVGAFPGLDYTLLHGIRTGMEQYEYADYDRDRLIACTSRDTSGDFYGRVTEYLRKNRGGIDRDARYYLCGNCDMIYEAFDILRDAGVHHNQLFAEVYF